MTAEELIIKNLDESDINCGATWIDDSLEPVLEVVIKTMEQYAKAKVLEALEREVPKACEFAGMRPMMNRPFSEGTEYYEREVKPKYQ